jgi:UrcA family protein
MGNAQAQNAPDLHKLTVKYGDLNLSTDTGARTLYRRIRGAARFVCGQEGRTIHEQQLWNDCYRSSIDGAVTAVHSPLLTQLYNSEHAKPQVTAMLAE